MIDPFRDPRSGVSLRDMMDRLFNEAFVVPQSRGGGGAQQQAAQGAQTPPVNMYETDNDLMVILPLPGASPNDIEVQLLGTQLTVRTQARRDVPHGEVGPQGGAPGEGDRSRRYLLHEFQIGPYARTVELPYTVEADRVQTSFEHGLLSLRFPCPEAKVPRRIEIKSS